MNETIMNTVIKTLAETIQRLQVDVDILKYENERLREQLKAKERTEGNG